MNIVEASIKRIERYSEPTHLDLEPYATIAKVIKDDNIVSYHIQLSQDGMTSDWKTFAEFLELIFIEYVENDDFVKELFIDFYLKNN